LSTPIVFNGSGYTIPAPGDSLWGPSLSSFFIAISTGALQKTGGVFTLTAEVDFGSSFGIKSSYFKSRTANPSSVGALRLAKTDSIGFRNNANSADVLLAMNGSDQLTFGGTKVILSGAIVNADVASNAAIAYSKLNLAGSLVNADINASAAVAYSKLNLSGSIVNADVNSSAAVAFSKLATTTSHRVVMTDSSGVLSAASRNVFNVLNYGADPTGVVDSTAAFQAAIDDALYGSVYVPYGHYKITSTLTIVRELIFYGEGMRESILEWSGGGNPIIHVTTGADNTTIDSIAFENTGTATHALLVDCIRAKVSRIFSNPTVKFSTAMISTNTSVTTYNMVFRDCVFYVNSNSQRTPIGLYLARGNTHTVDNCFFSGFPTSIIAGGAGGQPVVGCSIINSRFESFSGTSPSYPGANTDIGVDVVQVEGLNISGCNFEYDSDEGAGVLDQRCVKLQNAQGGFIGGNFMTGNGGINALINVASSSTGGIKITGNNFNRFVGYYAVEATGSGNIWNCEIDKNLIVSSDGTVRIAFNNMFTPAITFGGGNTGITYSAQHGRAWRQGKFITARLYVALSNKGSSTGTIRVTGLPVEADSNSDSSNYGNFDTPISVTPLNLSGVSGGIVGFMTSGGTSLRLYYTGTGTQTEIDNTNCGNSSAFEISLTYETP
jgi:hypothetical protein